MSGSVSSHFGAGCTVFHFVEYAPDRSPKAQVYPPLISQLRNQDRTPRARYTSFIASSPSSPTKRQSGSNSGVPKAARLLLSTAKESGVLFWKQIHPMFEDVSGKLPSDPGP